MSRSCAACWYLSAAPGVECPSRPISSASAVPNSSAGDAHPLSIKYLGVWDTVAALGLPGHWWLAGLSRRKYQFHDARLAGFVESARHAVAIDERRLTFDPTLRDNVAELNGRKGADPAAPNAHYQQKLFPGVHGSVGCGGD